MCKRLLCFAALLTVAGLGPASAAPARSLPYHATLTAPTHTPAVNAQWRYTVHVTNRRGQGVPASLRVYVLENGRRVNTIGWHGTKGTFSQTIRWPSSTRGHSLIFRVWVIATGGTTKLSYWVKPK
jgi:hypothetical protein